MAKKAKLSLTAKRPKPTVWIASSLRDIQRLPEDVQQARGKALMVAEFGGKDKAAEHFGDSLYEIKVDHDDGNTYRLIYTVEKPLLVYVLHTWNKKSHVKNKMDKADRDKIDSRRAMIEARYIADVEEKCGVKIDSKEKQH